MAWHIVAGMERTHGKNQAGRDLTKTLECPPADSRGSCGVRTVCLGLDSIMSVQAPSFSNLSGQPVLLLDSPHREMPLWVSPAWMLGACICVRSWLCSLCCISGGFALWFSEEGDQLPDLSVSPWCLDCSAHRGIGCLRIQIKMHFSGQEVLRLRECSVCCIWYPVSVELRHMRQCQVLSVQEVQSLAFAKHYVGPRPGPRSWSFVCLCCAARKAV